MKKINRYLILILCLFISACYFNLLQYPNKIVTGGVAGLSIIINKYLGLEPSIIIFIISIGLLIAGFFILGFDTISGTIVSSIIYPYFIDITKNLSFINISNLLLVSIIIGIMSGITTGIVFKIGFSNGGLSILSLILAKYSKISLSKIIFAINFMIVLIGGITIGLKMVIYAAIILLINSVIISIILKEKTF